MGITNTLPLFGWALRTQEKSLARKIRWRPVHHLAYVPRRPAPCGWPGRFTPRTEPGESSFRPSQCDRPAEPCRAHSDHGRRRCRAAARRALAFSIRVCAEQPTLPHTDIPASCLPGRASAEAVETAARAEEIPGAPLLTPNTFRRQRAYASSGAPPRRDVDRSVAHGWRQPLLPRRVARHSPRGMVLPDGRPPRVASAAEDQEGGPPPDKRCCRPASARRCVRRGFVRPPSSIAACSQHGPKKTCRSDLSERALCSVGSVQKRRRPSNCPKRCLPECLGLRPVSASSYADPSNLRAARGAPAGRRADGHAASRLILHGVTNSI